MFILQLKKSILTLGHNSTSIIRSRVLLRLFYICLCSPLRTLKERKKNNNCLTQHNTVLISKGFYKSEQCVLFKYLHLTHKTMTAHVFLDDSGTAPSKLKMFTLYIKSMMFTVTMSCIRFDSWGMKLHTTTYFSK